MDLINITITKRLNVEKVDNRVKITTDDSVVFLLEESMINQLLFESDSLNGTMVLEVSFEVDCKNGKYHVDYSDKNNSININEMSLKINDEQLMTSDMPIIDFYQLNDPKELDEYIAKNIQESIDQGYFDEYFRKMDKDGMDWSHDEASFVYSLYKMSKKVDSVGIKAEIDRAIQTGKINRTPAAIVYKMNHFKFLESDGDSGMGNIGKVFVDVFNGK